ncbi:hypothetical protein JTB14_014751 [Gonioctena quinquepunctata]|nr:hypothetical protein JTB14_014751 [Gonioctena quinquepunctata]
MNSQEHLEDSGVLFMAQQFQLLNSTLATLSAGMNDIRALAEQNEKIDGSMAHIIDLREKISRWKTNFETGSRKNVIIYGIDESDDDTKAVSDISLELNSPPKPPNPIKMHRLGKQDLPRIRPLKVEFLSRQEALSILVKRPQLPLKEFPNVNFKNDYTPRFRE